MPLRRDQVTTPEARQTGPKDAGSATRFTPEELNSLMQDAIARQGEARRQVEALGRLSTLDEALEVARDLDIDAEHVLAAADALHRGRLRTERRKAVRRGRGIVFFVSTAILALYGALSAGSGMQWGLWLGLLPLSVTLFFGWRWLFAPISDAESDHVELAPAAGICRVCGRPAHTPRATFCEEHRYKGPGGTA